MNKFKKVALLVLSMGLVVSTQTSISHASTIQVSVVMPNQWKDAISPQIEKFNASNTDVNINVLWGAAQDQLIAANKAPDIINTGDLYIVGQRDLLMDLTPFIKKSKTINVKDFYPNLYSALSFQGKQLALPYRFNVGLLYYNKTLFDAAKVTYPTATWKQGDFINAGMKMTKATGTTSTQWGSTSTFGWWGEWLIDVRQSGGDWLKDNVVALDSPAAITGLTFFRDKVTKYHIAPGPKDDSLGGFAGGKTAMEYGGHTGNWPSYNAVQGLKWDIQVLPRGSATTKGGELALEAWGVNAKTANPAAAYKVTEFLTSADFLAVQFSALGLPPTRISVANAALAVPFASRKSPQNLEALFAGIKSGMTLPRSIPFIKVTQEVVQPFIDKMLEGTLTPAQAGSQATAAANKALSID
jgi:multiple sugar transport system substrate-binding protein